MRPLPPTVSLALGATLLLAACGGDDDTAAPPGAGPADSSVTVIAEDIDFGADEYETEAGVVEFVYENEGNIAHTLLIEGVPFELMVRSNGDEIRSSVELEPGEYTLFCDVPGHRPAGMVATLTVT